MDHSTTPRGFSRFEFIDRYSQKCSLQKSSMASQDCIWLGVDVDLNGNEVHTRMHLTQGQVANLIPLLEQFAATGEI